ncbi:MAG TPA: 2-succinyl-6-hydroxy-2,4-cyclohexadiene-1-carboxylate synthase [Anaerolineae bacterium]
MKSRSFTVSDASYYVEAGGSGEPLVLLHGFSGSASNWAIHIPAFTQRYRVIAIDILGHGRSDAPADPARYRMENVAGDIAAVLAEVQAEPVHLLGYSIGGRLALYLAVTYPDLIQSLILESASPGLESSEEREQRRRQDEQLAAWIEQEGVEAFVQRWERLPLFASQQRLPPSIRDNLRRQRLQNSAKGLANSLRGMGTGAQPSLWPRLGELKIPVLLLAGEVDPKFVAIGERMAATIPFVDLMIVPEAGHTIHLERPELFDGMVLGWMGGQ